MLCENVTVKDVFPSYYQPTPEEFSRLWNEGWFVVDANVLLNLYRYQADTRADFLRVLSAIAARLWIPHQVAMEYQRNRRNAIEEHLRRFANLNDITFESFRTKVMDAVSTGKRALLDPVPFLEAVRPHFARFESHVAEIKSSQITSSADDSHDPIRNVLDHIFEGRIGRRYSSEDLDGAYSVGEARFERRTPPGYRDVKKKDLSEYEYEGRRYIRRYGDWILWKQVMEWSRERAIPYLVLVTDEQNEDWWEIRKPPGCGDMTMGPRPELGAEIRETAGVQIFHMYTPERFMETAAAMLHLDVRETSIDEAREVTTVQAIKARTVTTTSQSTSTSLMAWRIIKMLFHSNTINAQTDISGFFASDRLNFYENLLNGPVAQSLEGTPY